MLTFRDRFGDLDVFSHQDDDVLEDVLWHNRVPATSVIVTDSMGVPVADDHPLKRDEHYIATLIEGYDITSIRGIPKLAGAQSEAHAYLKRRLFFEADGSPDMETRAFRLEDVAQYVEDTVLQTLTDWKFPLDVGRLVVGLSGGVDSTSLLMALCAVRAIHPGFDVTAVTFEDFDSDKSPTFQHAKDVCACLGVEHRIAPASLALDTFRLRKPLRAVLPELMETKWAHQVMYIDHHTTRRCLEVVAKDMGVKSIALGLHVTDLMAGLLNGFCSGFNSLPIPRREVGGFSYWFPLAHVSKREAHLYHYAKTGAFASHTYPNAWERNPLDRNFYYYLADMLQVIWPGMELHVFEGHSRQGSTHEVGPFSQCRVCGAAFRSTAGRDEPPELCDVCQILRDSGHA